MIPVKQMYMFHSKGIEVMLGDMVIFHIVILLACEIADTRHRQHIVHGWVGARLRLSVLVRGVNRMVRQDSIRYRFSYPAIRYLPIPQKIIQEYID